MVACDGFHHHAGLKHMQWLLGRVYDKLELFVQPSWFTCSGSYVEFTTRCLFNPPPQSTCTCAVQRPRWPPLYQQLGHVHSVCSAHLQGQGVPKKGTYRMLLAGPLCAWIFLSFLTKTSTPKQFWWENLTPQHSILVRIFLFLLVTLFLDTLYINLFSMCIISTQSIVSLFCLTEYRQDSENALLWQKKKKLSWPPYRISKSGHDDLFHEAWLGLAEGGWEGSCAWMQRQLQNCRAPPHEELAVCDRQTQFSAVFCVLVYLLCVVLSVLVCCV